MIIYQNCVEKTEAYVKQALQQDASGHDWWHISRVRDMALYLAKGEVVNTFVIEMSALLHDIADDKLTKNAAEKLKQIEALLINLSIAQININQIMDIIMTMSFKGGQNKKPMKTLEGCIVQDADRLDAIGAIGIARVFAFAGSHGRLIYDPDLPIREAMTYDEYRNGESTAINHFYEKLLLLSQQMNTPQAKALANERHTFMEQYLKQFYKEWNGQA